MNKVEKAVKRTVFCQVSLPEFSKPKRQRRHEQQLLKARCWLLNNVEMPATRRMARRRAGKNTAVPPRAMTEGMIPGEETTRSKEGMTTPGVAVTMGAGERSTDETSQEETTTEGTT